MKEIPFQGSERPPRAFHNEVTITSNSEQPGLKRYEIKFTDGNRIVGADTPDGHVTREFFDKGDLSIRSGLLFSKELWGQADKVVEVVDKIQGATQLGGNALPNVLESIVSALIRQRRIEARLNHLRES